MLTPFTSHLPSYPAEDWLFFPLFPPFSLTFLVAMSFSFSHLDFGGDKQYEDKVFRGASFEMDFSRLFMSSRAKMSIFACYK